MLYHSMDLKGILGLGFGSFELQRPTFVGLWKYVAICISVEVVATSSMLGA